MNNSRSSKNRVIFRPLKQGHHVSRRKAGLEVQGVPAGYIPQDTP